MTPRPDPQHVGKGRLYYQDGTPRFMTVVTADDPRPSDELTLRTRCPNCEQRMTLHETAEEFVRGKPGCGDCAQAGVRPRLLYRLQLLRDDEE